MADKSRSQAALSELLARAELWPFRETPATQVPESDVIHPPDLLPNRWRTETETAQRRASAPG